MKRCLQRGEVVQVGVAFLASLFTIPLLAVITFCLRLFYDQSTAPHDGQSGMDAVGYGVLGGSLGLLLSYPVFSAVFRAFRRRSPLG